MNYKDQLKEYIDFMELVSKDLKDLLEKLNNGNELNKNDLTKISFVLEFNLGVSEDFLKVTKNANNDISLGIREAVKEMLDY